MNISESTIRKLRKKARSWLASLTYYSAWGKVNLDTFSKRLQSLFKPVLKPDILQGTIQSFISETIEVKETTSIKKRIMMRLTPDKVNRRMLSYLKIHSKNALAKDKPDSFTLGRLLITWAVLTNQSPRDFIVRVSSNITKLYKEWRDSTGCSGLSDKECYSHPKESARFWSGTYRTLIQATPEDNLIRFMHTGIEAPGAVIGIRDLEEEIYKLLGQAVHLVTRAAAKKIESALKANPCARERINIPELKALVLREEARLGWSKHTEKDALKTFWSSLSPELKEAVDNNGEVIRSSMEAVGRRGLLNNLEAALKGQLKPRFIESIWHFLQSVSRIVTSTWDFETSFPIKEQMVSIRQWLFRR